ncbi:hypothetical protein V1460_19340 [Streptomyces sp. SCSIO 30461]|uniref:hypothetical protein n=1 Tax=Streptomyces sp. SCSIO 30461 TaxID=3118085 RepID=UPI0030CD565C
MLSTDALIPAPGLPSAPVRAVVLPGADPVPAGTGTTTAWMAHETAYAIPRADARTCAQAGPGHAVDGGRARPAGGIATTVAAEGEAGPFGRLGGALAFEGNAPAYVQRS